jgi:hypothetical protein
MNTEIRNRFFENTSETGRFVVTSSVTGKSYFVEVIGDGRMADWGSYNPSTGNIENKKGAGKHSGSITAAESLITEENGFHSIWNMPKGCSPFAEIERRDKIYEAQGIRAKA